jgi:hypothetical protein
VKVVVLFTRSPTKLGLHLSDFSMIFYTFSKNQQTGNTIWETALNGSPWKVFRFTSITLFRRWAPRNNWEFAIGSSEATGGGPTKILASSRVLAAEKGRGSARVSPRVRFAPELEVGVAPTCGLDSTRRCTALRACPLRGRHSARATRGGMSF